MVSLAMALDLYAADHASPAFKKVGDAATKTSVDVKKASAAMQAAADAEVSAAGKIKGAEANLAAARAKAKTVEADLIQMRAKGVLSAKDAAAVDAKEKANVAALTKAEEELARVQRQHVAAQGAAVRSAEQYASATQKAAQEAKELGRQSNVFHKFGAQAQGAGASAGKALGGGLLATATKFAAPLAAAFAGAKLIGGIGHSIELAGQFESSIRQVGTATGVTGDKLKGLTALALDMGAKTSFSAQGAADAMLALAKGGLTQAQIKAGALSSTLTLATAGGLQLGEAADFMVQGLSAFGLKAGDAAGVAAALAGGANASTASVQSMGQALSQVGAQAHTAGLSIQDTTAALAAFDNAGIKGSDAGTSLKTFLQNLVPSTAKAREEFRNLGLMTFNSQKAMDVLRKYGVQPLGRDASTLTTQLHHLVAEQTGAEFGSKTAAKAYDALTKSTGIMSNAFFDAKGNIKSISDVSQTLQEALKGQTREQKIATLNTLFGSDASRAAGILAADGARGLAKFVKATNDKAQADKLAKSATEGYAGAMEKFKGAVETAQIQFGSKLLPTITHALGYLSDQGIPTLQAMGDILEKTLAPALGRMKGGLNGFIDYLASHQAEALGFFQKVGDTVLDFSKMAVLGAANALDGFNTFFQGIGRGIVSLAESLNNLPGINIDVQSIKDSLDQVDRGTKRASDGLRQNLIPTIDRMRDRFDKASKQEIISAKQRDAMAAAATAVEKIGTKADGSQIQLKKFSDISKLSAGEQAGLRSRIAAASKALADQLAASKRAGDGQKDLTKTWKDGRAKLVDEFEQMGLSTKAAQKLADKYAGIKPKVETKITQPGMGKAQADAEDIRKAYDKIPKYVTTKINFDTQVDKINTKLSYKYGKTARLIGYADGGVLPGYTPGKDVHEFWSPTGGALKLSGGEGIMRPEWVRQIGGPSEVARQNKAAKSGQAFAAGGVFGEVMRDGTSSVLKDGANAVASTLKSAVAAIKAARAAAAAAAAASGTKYSSNGAAAGFSASQVANAATIASVGSSMGKRAQMIGIATAIVESGLRNLTGGDRDSVGLFQQRAPWGSFAARHNPRTSAGMFFHGGRGGQRGLDDVNWKSMSPGAAAQAVQVSAFPGRYAQQMSHATSILNSLSSNGGGSGGGGGKGKGGRHWPTTGRIVSTYPGHDGIDINGPGQDYGNPIYAYRSGKITYAGWGKGYGHAIFENPDVGASVVYGHGSKVYVKSGDRVSVGEMIGRVGSTGHSTGPHLHFGHPGGTSGQARAMLAGLADGGVLKFQKMFDSGGLARGQGLMPKRTIQPERVLAPKMTGDFERLVTWLEQNGAPGARGGPLQHVEHQHIASNVDLDLVLRQQEFRQRSGSFT